MRVIFSEIPKRAFSVSQTFCAGNNSFSRRGLFNYARNVQNSLKIKSAIFDIENFIAGGFHSSLSMHELHRLEKPRRSGSLRILHMYAYATRLKLCGCMENIKKYVHVIFWSCLARHIFSLIFADVTLRPSISLLMVVYLLHCLLLTRISLTYNFFY